MRILAKEINSYEGLFKQIKLDMAKQLEELSVKIEGLWFEYLESFYDTYDPIIYERQYAILKALVKTKPKIVGNSVSVEVYIDMNIMNQYHPNSQGDWEGEQVVNMIENTGMTLTNGVRRNPVHAYESVVKWLRTDYERFLKSKFK